MSELILPRIRRQTRPAEALSRAAAAWFLTALAGQWLFVLYILGLYGRKTVQGGLPAWADTHLPNGYIPGDTIGNSALAAHILLAVIIHGSGPLQLVPQIRKRLPTFHRWNGRLFLTLSVTISIAGLYLTWARQAGFGGLTGQLTVSAVAVLIFLFAAQTLRFAMRRDIAAHRRWALRLFMAASAVWFARLIMYGGIFATSKLGIDYARISEGLILLSQFGQFVLPLAILEFYLRARASDRPETRSAATGLLVLATMLTGIGIYAAATLAWLPRIGA